MKQTEMKLVAVLTDRQGNLLHVGRIATRQGRSTSSIASFKLFAIELMLKTGHDLDNIIVTGYDMRCEIKDREIVVTSHSEDIYEFLESVKKNG